MLLGLTLSGQAQLTVTNDLRLWLRADAGVATNSSGNVTNWSDQTISGLDLSQSTAGLQPLWVTNAFNGQPVVRFNGTSYLARTAVPLSSLVSSNECDVFMVLQPRGGYYLMSILAPDLGNSFALEQYGGVLEFTFGDYIRGGIMKITQPPDWMNNFHVVELYRHGGVGKINTDTANLGVAAFTDTLDTAQSGTLDLGAWSGVYGWDGDMAEVLCYSRVLTAAEKANVSAYLSGKYAFRAPTPATAETLLDQSWRYPVISVPFALNVPALEGRVDGLLIDNEVVSNAMTELQDFVTVDAGSSQGFAAAEQTKVYIDYTAGGLYLAFNVYEPDSMPVSVTVTNGHDLTSLDNDDLCEIFFVPDETTNQVFHFAGNAAGITRERIILNGASDWSNWNPPGIVYAAMPYGTTHSPCRWSSEWFIPWSALKLTAPPAEGTIWGANFVTKRHQPVDRLDAWSHWSVGQYPDVANTNNGHIIFGNKRQTLWMMRSTDKALTPISQENGTSVSVWAPYDTASAPRKIQVSFNLYRQYPAGSNSFLAELESALATPPALTFDDELDDVLNGFDLYQSDGLYGNPQWLPQSYSFWGAGFKANMAGNYVFRFMARDVTNPTNAPLALGGGAVPFQFLPGVHISKLSPYLLTRQSIVLTSDIRAEANRAGVTHLRGLIRAPGGGTTYATATIDAGTNDFIDLEVSTTNVPAGGTYDACLQALDAGDTVLSEAVMPFERPPDPDWWTNRRGHGANYGGEPAVPDPWTPIRTLQTGSRVTCDVWGRELVFSNSVLPLRIAFTNPPAPADYLAAPVHLELTVAGVLQPLATTGFSMPVQTNDHVMLVATQEAAGVRITGSSVLEFDGFSLIDLTIEPTGAAVANVGLDLVIPINAACAELLQNSYIAPGPGTDQGRYLGKVPTNGYASPPMLTTWLGTDKYGLEWSCESSKGWYLTNANHAIVVTRINSNVEARFHLSDGALNLQGRRTIRFGLLPTPTKRTDPKWRNWRVNSATACLPPTTSFDDFYQNYASCDAIPTFYPLDWSGTLRWNRFTTNAASIAKLQEAVGYANTYGIKEAWYGGWGVQLYSPDWHPWGEEMLMWPVQEPGLDSTIPQTYASPFVEFMVGSWAQNVRQYGLHGVRFDSEIPWYPSLNPWLGETWTNDAPGSQTGVVFGTQSLFRQREMFKGLWRESLRQSGEQGLIWSPLPGPPINAIHSFATMVAHDEGSYMKGTNLMTAYPQDLVRALMPGGAYGVEEEQGLKNYGFIEPISRMAALVVADVRPRLSSAASADSPTYDPPPGSGLTPTRHLWDAWSWIDRSSAQWCPHWNNSNQITTAGSGTFYVSLHLQAGKRVLLAASNYETNLNTVTVTLNRNALGFDTNAILTAQDAVTLEPVPMNGDQLNLRILPERFRLVKIGPASEINGANLDPEPKHATRCAVPVGSTTLAVTNRLSLWLRADMGVTASGDKVSAWADQSGNGNHASQASADCQPAYVTNAYSSLPVVRFDGSNDYLSIANDASLNAGTNAFSIFALYRYTSNSVPGVVYGKYSSYPYEPPENVAADTVRFAVGANHEVASTGGLNDGTFRLWEFRRTTDGALEQYRDCIRVSQAYQPGLNLDNTNAAYVGGLPSALVDGVPYYQTLQGDVAEILVFNRELSRAERDAVIGHLATRYLITPPWAVNLTAPADGTRYTTIPATVSLAAVALGYHATIDRLEFYQGNTLLGTSTVAPYSCTWSNVPAGSYTLTALAYNHDGAVAGSAPIGITVAAPTNSPPADFGTVIIIASAAVRSRE